MSDMKLCIKGEIGKAELVNFSFPLSCLLLLSYHTKAPKRVIGPILLDPISSYSLGNRAQTLSLSIESLFTTRCACIATGASKWSS